MKMPNTEEFIKELLIHAEEPYNSQQAHEYYLRNRELKGRQPAAQKPIPISRNKNAPPAAVKTGKKVVKGGKAPVLISVKRQQAVDGRVSGLQERLAKLETRLTELLDKAKKKEEKKNEPEKKSDLTAKQKQSAEKSSEKYAKENKEEIAKKAKEKREEDPDANLSIDEVRAKIVKIKAELKEAIQKARQKSSNNKTVQGR